MATLLSFEKHRQLVDLFWEKFLSAPVPGFGVLSLDHLKMADEFFFCKLSELTKAGFCSSERCKYDGCKHLYRAARLSTSSASSGTAQPPPLANSARTKRENFPISKRPKVGPRVPSEFQDCVALMPDHTPICFGYNLGTRKSNTRPGDKCGRGLH
eukprot:2877817-Amphidinium_carterae.1